jgi:hypothetical protein
MLVMLVMLMLFLFVDDGMVLERWRGAHERRCVCDSWLAHLNVGDSIRSSIQHQEEDFYQCFVSF